MKKDRQRSQKDASLLENKLKLLANEEFKLSKKAQIEKKNIIKVNKIRKQVFEEKMATEHAKLEKLREINQRRNNTEKIKENLNSSIRGWRTNLESKNKTIVNEYKNEKVLNEKFVEINKLEETEKKKQICNEIKVQKLWSAEKKKRDDLERKLKMRLELEAKILEEERVKILCQVLNI
jgi:hypothetical protein